MLPRWYTWARLHVGWQHPGVIWKWHVVHGGPWRATPHVRPAAHVLHALVVHFTLMQNIAESISTITPDKHPQNWWDLVPALLICARHKEGPVVQWIRSVRVSSITCSKTLLQPTGNQAQLCSDMSAHICMHKQRLADMVHVFASCATKSFRWCYKGQHCITAGSLNHDSSTCTHRASACS